MDRDTPRDRDEAENDDVHRADQDLQHDGEKAKDGKKSKDDDAAALTGGISTPFIRHPIATSLLMVGILFVGIVAYPLLPVAPLPQVDFPTIQVSAQLPGASPETMASAVAQPLETQFAQIPGVSQETSISTEGSTAISTRRRRTCRPPSPPHSASCPTTSPRRPATARSIRPTARS